MFSLQKFSHALGAVEFLKEFRTLVPTLAVCECCYFSSLSNQNPSSSISPFSSEQRVTQNSVGIFWDLDNKPQRSFSPYEAAISLKKAAQGFGFVKYMFAYANRHAFNYVPPIVGTQKRERKGLNELETMGVKSNEPLTCQVCGRRFFNNERLVNHFKQIHEREQMSRLNQIESARGKRRINLVAKYSMKMDKYRNAARDVLTPKIGYGLSEELKRAGFWVRTVSDKPHAADVELRSHMMDMMDKSKVECLILVSDDSDFVGILREARMRCLKTVVVGDISDSALKRNANAAFSWQEIMRGKAKKEAGSVVGKWKDQNVLKRLEWTYDPKTEKNQYFPEVESECSDFECLSSGECGTLLPKESDAAWWEWESRAIDLDVPPSSLK
ncbi:nucleic acid binding protein [Dorcoceras hygrometricum]|uniref:Nucleic acid binding protein n=1 Tax=Dorcoceras hygrometricum TaxID=472368 RepID=A0A2Z7AF71_9LAMI|nr:nucleic acid binding protein [Dorcoceras hygrometricum]